MGITCKDKLPQLLRESAAYTVSHRQCLKGWPVTCSFCQKGVEEDGKQGTKSSHIVQVRASAVEHIVSMTVCSMGYRHLRMVVCMPSNISSFLRLRMNSPGQGHWQKCGAQI